MEPIINRNFISTIIVCSAIMFMTEGINANPANWCREGHFPENARIDAYGIIKKNSKKRTYFYHDNSNCPDKYLQCRTNSYLIPGDSVILAGQYRDFYCALYSSRKEKITVGWILKSDVKLKKTSVSAPDDWTGTWKYYESEINISKTESGRLYIRGTSVWLSSFTVHTGEFEINEKPVKIKIENAISSPHECGVRLILIAGWLVVSDNKKCGGVNVTFDGVYSRKK
ncbi:MAG: hypothetical protein OEZ34_00510 [Spirochaetia bacterium]|nr:hypothetical protein [Spirochaetia bacterium]